MSNTTDIWLKNSEIFFKSIINIISEKSVIYNYEVHVEMLFIRRLFVDWIVASNNNFTGIRKYVQFKSSLVDHFKSFSVDNDTYFGPKYVIIFKDFDVFMSNHGDYFLDIYHSCVVDCRKNINFVHKMFIFSIVSVVLFYKWRKKRNDSIRHWMSYNNRRKKKFNVDMSSFDNLVLNEAKKYGIRYKEKITRYTL